MSRETIVRNLPFRQPGRFFKGNLHTHSTRSDGALEPEAVVAAYREHGYDFLALTDHFLAPYDFPITDTRAFRDESFTTLLGAELMRQRPSMASSGISSRSACRSTSRQPKTTRPGHRSPRVRRKQARSSA